MVTIRGLFSPYLSFALGGFVIQAYKLPNWYCNFIINIDIVVYEPSFALNGQIIVIFQASHAVVCTRPRTPHP